MTGKRAARFPLGLEDLVREPRRAEGRPGEARANAAAAAFGDKDTRSGSTLARTKSAIAKPKGLAATAGQSALAPSAKPAGSLARPSRAPAVSTSPIKPAQVKPATLKPAAKTGVIRAAAHGVAHPVSHGGVKAAVKAAAKPPVNPASKADAKATVVAPRPAIRPAAPVATAAAPQPRASVSQPLARATRPAHSPARQAAGNAASQKAAAPAAPHVLTSERVRERMVERLRANGIADPRVLHAMAAVPRHLFVDAGLATQAYEDAALPIGHHQTISKPSVVARMIELAAAGRELNNVLEIGTGCGYQAAVLSLCARDVYSIERIKPLYERAKANLRPLRIPNIRLHYGDGRIGLPSVAPFDAIVIAAAGLDVPQALREQLAIGGRLIAPVGGQDAQHQVLTLVERTGPAQWRESRLDRVFFVPLKSGVI